MNLRPQQRALVLSASFVVYNLLVGLCALRHQPWFDEAQSWLLARDLSFGQLLFHQMRYEGSPALWPVLLMLLQKLGLTYSALNLVSALIGVIGVTLFLWLSPLPVTFKALFPFCYFPLFQFSVIARSYVLYLPLLGLIAHVFPLRLRRAGTYWLLLALLANVSMHGALIAGVLVADWLWSAYRERAVPASGRRVFWLFLAASAALYASLFLQLRFPPDLLTQLTPVTFATRLLRVGQQVREAFFGGIGGNVSKAFGLVGALLVLAVSTRWFRRAGTLGLFACMITPLLLLALVRATYWHAGVIFLVWIFTLWISYRSVRTFDRPLVIAICAVFAVQITFGIESVHFQLTHVFSGSKAAAAYLREHGSQNPFAVAPESFAVQPYFKRNLFASQEQGRAAAFYPWTISLNHDALEGLDESRTNQIVLRYGGVGSGKLLSELSRRGYCEDRRFPGSIWWKNAELQPDVFVILSRCKWR